jgi:hypothetical protein
LTHTYSIQFEGDDAGHNICFETGHELGIALVSAAIATICGPMTLEHPSSREPWLTLLPSMSDDEVVALVENAPTD